LSGEEVSGDRADAGGMTETVHTTESATKTEPAPIAAQEAAEEALWAELWIAIDACILAKSHLQHWLKEDHPPLTASLAEGVKHYAELSAPFDLWAGCRGIERLRNAADAWRRATAPVAASRPEATPGTPRRLL
jgi:hypothetical protein